MGRGLGYQHQYYGYGNDGGGMWMDSAQAQAQQQQSHAVYQESWGAQNEYPQHKQFPGMHMKPPPSSSAFGGGFGIQESFENGCYGSSAHHPGYASGAPNKFAFGGGDKFNSSGYNRSEEVAEYDYNYSSEQLYGAMMKQEHEDDMRMRFERHNYGSNPYRSSNIPPVPQYPPFGYWTEKRI